MLVGALQLSRCVTPHTRAHADAHRVCTASASALQVTVVSVLHQHSRFAVLASKLKAGLAAAVFDNILHEERFLGYSVCELAACSTSTAQRSTAQQHTSSGTQRQHMEGKQKDEMLKLSRLLCVVTCTGHEQLAVRPGAGRLQQGLNRRLALGAASLVFG